MADEFGAIAWYHTMELPGVGLTRGHYDLRGVASDVLPADLTGKRCLDACSANGFWAFEMEKRGAAAVVAIDVGSQQDKDWRRPWLAPDAEQPQGAGFQAAKTALNSAVERKELSVYDASPQTLGKFDFAFLGSVLLHLRDPVRALRALHGVTNGEFMSFEPILPISSVLRPRTPVGRMVRGDDARWWMPNAAAHVAWLDAAGFEVVARSRHRQPFGRQLPRLPHNLPRTSDSLGFWLGTRHLGVLSQRLLARPIAT